MMKDKDNENEKEEEGLKGCEDEKKKWKTVEEGREEKKKS
jgi:hypothetical protein